MFAAQIRTLPKLKANYDNIFTPVAVAVIGNCCVEFRWFYVININLINFDLIKKNEYSVNYYQYYYYFNRLLTISCMT
jgi:hypothetical protein